jgi:hypothetical protein
MRTRDLGLGLMVLAAALPVLSACGGGETAPAAVPALFSASDIPAAPSGLNDRDGLAALAGLPDLFDVSYEVLGAESEPEGRVVRYETWTYFDLLTAYEFADGRFVAMYPVDDVEGMVLVPNHLDPRDFDRALTWDVLFERLGRPDGAASSVLPPEYEVEATAYAIGQLLAVFDADGLVFVESVPLLVGAAP